MPDIDLTPETEKSILQGMRRVLNYRSIERPVEVSIEGRKYCWVCRPTPDGGTRCSWEPC